MFELYYGDCLEIMPQLEAGSVDLILTDPPYGTTACKWDNVIPFEPMWEQVWRVLKSNGACLFFGTEPFSSHLRLSQLKAFRYDWIWHKSNPANIASAKSMPMKYHEIISVFSGKKRESYFPQMIERKSDRMRQAHASNYVFKHGFRDLNSKNHSMTGSCNRYEKDVKFPSTILQFNSLRPNSKEKVKFTTQKPVALLEHLIKTYTQKNETVLDFTMGSGSTGVACQNLNRCFIGIEKNEKYFKIAEKRIQISKDI